MYKIIRFSKHGNPVHIESVSTLEEAQAICKDPKTKGHDWFYGYEKEEE